VGAEAGAVQTPLRRSDLITQGDEMLATLQWEQERAKSFLQSKLGATSRQQLSDEQLLEFNMFLEEQTMKAAT
jgi:phage protein D